MVLLETVQKEAVTNWGAYRNQDTALDMKKEALEEAKESNGKMSQWQCVLKFERRRRSNTLSKKGPSLTLGHFPYIATGELSKSFIKVEV